MNFRTVLAAAAIALAPVAASAGPVNGSLELDGTLVGAVPDDFMSGGSIALQSAGDVVNATGAFALAGIGASDEVAFLTSLTFDATGIGETLFSVKDTFALAPDVATGSVATFEITDFVSFYKTPTEAGFQATGLFNVTGYDETEGFLTFGTEIAPQDRVADYNMTFSVTAQVPLPASILLIATAMAGFGVMFRRKKRLDEL